MEEARSTSCSESGLTPRGTRAPGGEGPDTGRVDVPGEGRPAPPLSRRPGSTSGSRPGQEGVVLGAVVSGVGVRRAFFWAAPDPGRGAQPRRVDQLHDGLREGVGEIQVPPRPGRSAV